MNPRRTQILIGVMLLTGAGAAGYAGFMSHELHAYYALAVLALAAATSRMKVKLPGITGNMSVNLPFLLAAVVSLSGLEAVAIACVSTLVQCWPAGGGKWKPAQVVFNVSMIACASSMAGMIFHSQWLRSSALAPEPLAIALASGTFFLGQTIPVATIIAFSEEGAIGRIWLDLAHLSFPYYVVSAGMAAMMQTVDHRLGWEAALAVFPVMYGIHRSYRQ